ncbi:xylulokinase [Scatolibacter rhodanostii]|uniref:xylulokinase n=1 Tax=Scatolibacter rhodanostii TaxID=2014781 RepID=UPI000C07209B|nr:FGGY-family carbohydrate kinase [Scatolibacter rhodanostii]
MKNIAQVIEKGKASLGIEFGSTRIKAILIDEENTPIASGAHDWDNQLEDGIWTYSLDSVWKGVQDCYQNLLINVREKYNVSIVSLASIGISGMMHGYMPFDKDNNLLVPFRTWRNTMTESASEQLTELFQYPIPQRWSIAHLYQAILNNESHVSAIDFLTTLAGYVHWQLTDEKVAGIGEAAGMFPVDFEHRRFDKDKIEQFDELLRNKNYAWKLNDILPKVLVAGDFAGKLTDKGAKLLDVSGNLKEGALLCAPEGDAGTGMVATNSVRVRTGNVSAGTSVFAMVVLEKELSSVYSEIDLVTTPSGDPVAMVHCNNCTSDLNAWVHLFKEFADLSGANVKLYQVFDFFYEEALKNGNSDCGGLLAYNYLSGEHITKMEEGRPLFVRRPDSQFTLANFMRVHLYTALGALKMGMDILTKQEKVALDKLLGHGGLFKTPIVGQKIMASAMNTPVSVMETASEGGAWGIALLSSYLVHKAENETLDQFLDNKVFASQKEQTIQPDPEINQGFERFMKDYVEGLAIERAAIDSLKI